MDRIQFSRINLIFFFLLLLFAMAPDTNAQGLCAGASVVDADFLLLWPSIREAQREYVSLHRGAFQGLPTHTTTPNVLAPTRPDNLLSRPSDTDETWLDFIQYGSGITIPSLMAYSMAIDSIELRQGFGYIVRLNTVSGVTNCERLYYFGTGGQRISQWYELLE